MSGPSSRADDSQARARTAAKAKAALALALATCGLTGLAACGRAGGDSARRGEPLRVAAAADLALAFREIGAAFEKQTGKKVDFAFGSTGLLAKQIEEGAPFDVFAAANVSFVDEVVKAGACTESTKQLYAKGRIVLWSKDAANLPSSVEALKDPKYAKIAIANPEHAPYGRAAREAMTKAGAWATAEPRAVYGDNVQQALMFAQSGNAEVAIVALSLAISSPGHFVPIDPSLHEPLDQAMVVCSGGSKGPKTNEARAFVDFVSSEPGRALMRKHGFLLPGESLSAK